MSIYCLLSGIILISIAPHQEPRFLIPLSIPIALILGSKSKNFNHFFTISVVFSILMAILFGSIHQGGVIRTVLNHRDYNSHVFFYKTYMPTDYLNFRMKFTDLKGSNEIKLKESVQKVKGRKYIVYPSTISIPFKIESSEYFCPHFSGEDLPKGINEFDNLCLVKSKIHS